MKPRTGTLFGIGAGPGDPELMTLKAVRLLKGARIVAFFRKKGAPGHAFCIAGSYLSPNAAKLAFEYPCTTEVHFSDAAYVDALSSFYASTSDSLRHLLEEGEDIALLCEGDPFFYGSFLHIYERLHGLVPIVVVPGVTGMSGCWTAARTPIALGDDVLTVLPGILEKSDLTARLASTDAAVIMKVGCNLAKISEALHAAGRFDDAIYVEKGTMAGERIAPLRELKLGTAPYFSVVLVPASKRRRSL